MIYNFSLFQTNTFEFIFNHGVDSFFPELYYWVWFHYWMSPIPFLLQMWMHRLCTGVGKTPKEKTRNMKTLSGRAPQNIILNLIHYIFKFQKRETRLKLEDSILILNVFMGSWCGSNVVLSLQHSFTFIKTFPCLSILWRLECHVDLTNHIVIV